MTRAEFYDTHFKNCEFLSIDLVVSNFDSCKLEITRFFKSNLNFILVENSKFGNQKNGLKSKIFLVFRSP